MITVLFFARLREALGTAEVTLNFTGTVAELKEKLIADNGDAWQALNGENILCAVNQAVVRPHSLVEEGDEVAFYPPVTGG